MELAGADEPVPARAADGAGLAEGELVDGRYQCERRLGRGGVGEVWSARELDSRKRVALKLLDVAGGAEAARRFEREAELAARVDRGGGVVRVHASGQHRGRTWVAMELVEGPDLGRVIAAEGPLEPRRAARIVLALARTLAGCHAAGVLHRDLKPANVLLAAGDTPRLCDFGLARDLVGEERLTRTGEVLGTPAFMAPEQAADAARAVDARVDVWGLGAILYVCLTGRPPFTGATPLETLRRVLMEEPTPPGRLRAGLPAGLEEICRVALAKDPADRYPGAAELADELERWLTDLPLARTAPRGWPRRPVALAVGALVAVALACAGGAMWAAPRALRAHERWEEEVLRASSLGLLEGDPDLPQDELEARARRLRSASWLLGGESARRCARSLRRLALPAVLARLRGGEPPSPAADDDGPGLLAEGLALLQAGDARQARVRLRQAQALGEDGLALRVARLRAEAAVADAQPGAAAEVLALVQERRAELARAAPGWAARERPLLEDARHAGLRTLASELSRRALGLDPAGIAAARAGWERQLQQAGAGDAERKALCAEALEATVPAWGAALEAVRGGQEALDRVAVLASLRGEAELPTPLVNALERMVMGMAPVETQARVACEVHLRLGVPVRPAVATLARAGLLLQGQREAPERPWLLLTVVLGAGDGAMSGAALLRHFPRDPAAFGPLSAVHPRSRAVGFLLLLDGWRREDGHEGLFALAESAMQDEPGSDLAPQYRGEAAWRLLHLLRKQASREPRRAPELLRRAVVAGERARRDGRGGVLLDAAGEEVEALIDLDRRAEGLRVWAETIRTLRGEVDAAGTGPGSELPQAVDHALGRGLLARALNKQGGLLEELGEREAALVSYRESLELYRLGAVPGSSTHPADTLGELVELLLKLDRDDEASALLPPPGDPAWADDELARGAVRLALRRGDRAAAERVLEWARRATGDPPPDWLGALEGEVQGDARR